MSSNPFGKTDKGRKRTNNEDSFFLAAPFGMFDAFMAVADGMGGHSYGEVASSLAISVIVDYLQNAPVNMPGYLLEQAIEKANRVVYKKSVELETMGMGTTIVLAAAVGRDIFIANVGDSRAYYVDPKKYTIKQITKDHSYVEEMVEKGLMKRGSEEYERSKNVITRAVGTLPKVRTDLFEQRMRRGSYLLLCTDGLSGMVQDIIIKNLILDETFPMERKVDSLIYTANERGGKDNITVVLYQAEEDADA
ncbi:MAG: Stp1/IreP family PP2C-type Ser/Thr phosphatase [Lachnospiraceae bacterium]|nr:Stp1/IreP family PP2C-type Ser/Thr phosphatase [Lachnospiraceae bacterium]